jgi:hypothetical protein
MVKVADMPDVTGSQMRESRHAFGEANHALAPYNRILDIYTTRWLSGGKKKKGPERLVEIDFLKAPEAKDFLLAETEAEAKQGFTKLSAKDREFAGVALAKARDMAFLHWELGFPEVFYGPKPGTERDYVRLEDGGFDAVIGNPPWIRQEGIKEAKPALEAIFPEVYAAEADIYAYFIARGTEVLRRGGRFGMILQNKWLKAAYARKLRTHLSASQHLLEIVNFGHAPLFDADTFPCLFLLKRPESAEWTPEGAASIEFFEVDRKALPIVDLEEYGRGKRSQVTMGRLRPEGWELTPKLIGDLMERVRGAGVPLSELARSRPYRGIITGLNEAFIVDDDTRNGLTQLDPNCDNVVRRFVRGEDIRRWHLQWGGEWIILLRSSHDKDWSWSQLSEPEAEAAFKEAYPALYARFKPFEGALRSRQDRGKFWWELRACDYYDCFESPKLCYQEIQYHSRFALDLDGLFMSNKAFLLPGADAYLVAVLNSSVVWWFLERYIGHLKDEAFAMQSFKMEHLPIAPPTAGTVEHVERLSVGLQTLTQARLDEQKSFSECLTQVLGPMKLGPKLESYWRLDEHTFSAALGKSNSFATSPLGMAEILKEFRRSRAILREIGREACKLEIELHHLVFVLYGLTPEEVRLVRETAPPRDPLTLTEQELAQLEEP